MEPPGNTSWVVTIKEQLQALAEARTGPLAKRRCCMFRVPPPLRVVKPKDFTPGLISFGLYGREISKTSRMDRYRLEVTSAFLETLDKTTDDWTDICEKVVPNPQEMREMYDDLPGPDCLPPAVVQCLLTLDAIFLASVYAQLITPDGFKKLEDSLYQDGLFSQRYLPVDVMLLENQIPLELIRNVLELLYRVDKEEAAKRLHLLCIEAIVKYSRLGSIPGSGDLYTHVESVVGNPKLTTIGDSNHLLECLHKVICLGVDDCADQWVEEKGTLVPGFVSLPTVSQLRAANLKFRGDTRGISEVKFVPGMFKATLYLPMLVIDATTERLWRNLVAFENVSADTQHEFMCYLELMDDLVDTSKDVEWLRKGKAPVISQNFLGNDKDVATIFNSLLQNCRPNRSLKWILLRKEINSYYNKKYIKLYSEFTETYFGKPWIFISVLAATVLLILTFLQTVYTIKSTINSSN